MAVVQISKIQVRRGQKKTAGNIIPQLSSAEFAWAVDTQELYIGNGSITEGAPAVGNTKILTEHDNLLDLIASYTFGGSYPAVTRSVPRGLQSKLDEYVSVIDYGAKNDGLTDCVAAFEAAFEDLFSSTEDTVRKILTVPNGEYHFATDLSIPGTAIIQGETQDGVVLNIGANNILFTTELGLGVASFTNVNRPRNVIIENLTILKTTGQLVLTGVASSSFNGIKFKGNYVLGDTLNGLTSRDAAVYWENNFTDLKVDDIHFNNCVFDSVGLGIKCLQTAVFDTRVYFTGTKFFVADVGVYVDGVATQVTAWTFDNCLFEEVANQAFISTNGFGTLFLDTEFKDCGNGVNDAQYPEVEILSFGESKNNRLVNCKSNRHQKSALTEVSTTVGYSEAVGASSASFVDRNYFGIDPHDSAKPLAAFSATNKYIYIHYTLSLGSHTRAGKLTITVDNDLTNASLTDEYQYSASLVANPGGALMTNFNFSVDLLDNNSDTIKDTVLLSYENPLATGASGTIDYNVSYGV